MLATGEGSAGMMALMGTFTVVSNVAFVAACGIFRMMGDVSAERGDSVRIEFWASEP